MTVTVEEPTGTPLPPAPPSRALDRTVRIAGVLVSVLATLVTGVAEVMLTTWRIAGVTTGVSIPLAVLANLAIAWFAVTTTGRRWAVGPPWALWTLIMFFAAAVRTEEGDYLLGADDWVGLVMILVGSLAFAVHAYRLIMRGPTVTKQ